LAKKDEAAAARLTDVGYRYLSANDYGQAGHYFTEALALDPEQPYALLNMGVVRDAEGRPEEALEFYAKVIALDPVERVVDSTDASQQGALLTEVARKNLARILSTHPLLQQNRYVRELRDGKAEKKSETPGGNDE
ncbi:MAG: tetratricopeptide repeat protein, partial [Desulfobulbaceae bacterium]|nr:tetratricopeptide repeat protein [Desulfobulbaceae bacterium]